nr:2-oxo-4-hydroxy-4-carboxy-5-ureidoimidazoline decarboxylase [Thiolinea sp.]
MKTLAELNALPVDTFTDYCAAVYEHSPWIPRQAAALRPFANAKALLAALSQVLAQAEREQQLALIRAHPDLAGRAAL